MELPAERPPRLAAELSPDLVVEDYHVTVAVLSSGLYRSWAHSWLNQTRLPPQIVSHSMGSRVTWTWALKIDDAGTSFASTDENLAPAVFEVVMHRLGTQPWSSSAERESS